MSINNLGGMNPDNINPNNQRHRDNNTQNAQNGNGETPALSPANSAYGQLLVNHNYDVTSSRANDNDAEMREIYEIDREAFADLDPYDNYESFKSLIERENISVYSVKDNNNQIIGYYSLEPVKSGDMYIDSIGLKPQYRNSRKGYAAIQHSWKEINQIARENGAETLSLHVDATNPRLKRMYEQFGFEVEESYDNYYENGSGAYYMTMALPSVDGSVEVSSESVTNEDVAATSEQGVPISENAEVSDINIINNNEETLPDEEPPLQAEPPSRKQLLKDEYKQKSEMVNATLRELGSDSIRFNNTFLEKCTFKDKETGENVFSDKLYQTALMVYDIVKDEEEWSRNDSFSKIMRSLTYTDENGEMNTQAEVIPQIIRMKNAKIRLYDFNDILDACKIDNSQGQYRIDSNLVDKAIEIKQNWYGKVSSYEIDDVINLCKLVDKDGTETFCQDAFDRYRTMITLDDKSEYEAKDIMSACAEYDVDDKEYFDKSFCRKLCEILDKRSYDDPRGFRYYSQIKDIKRGGCSVKNYLEFSNRILYDNTIKEALKKYNKNSDIGVKDEKSYPDTKLTNVAAIINATIYPYATEETTDSTGRTYKLNKYVMDTNAFNAIKETLQKEPMPFDNLKNLADIVKACRIKDNAYSNEQFDPKLLQKAIELKENGISDQYITDILNACRTKDKLYADYYEEKFSDEAFNAVIDYKKTREHLTGINPNIIKLSMNMAKDKEYFSKETFDYLSKHFVCDDYYGGADAFVEEFTDYSYNKHRYFNLDLYKKFYEDANCQVSIISDSSYNDKTGKTTYHPREDAIEAYKELKSRDIKYDFGVNDTKDVPTQILYVCRNDYGYQSHKFLPQVYQHAIELLDEGYGGNQVVDLLRNCRTYKHNPKTGHSDLIFEEERYAFARKLMAEGVDIANAGSFANRHLGTTIKDGVMTNDGTEAFLELYRMGVTHNTDSAHWRCYDNINGETKFNPIAYNCLKEAVKRGLPAEIIQNCKDEEVFSEDLFMKALNLQDRGFSSDTVNKLMSLSHDKKLNPETGTHNIEKFMPNIYDHIADMEELGIDKDAMADIIKACKYRSNSIFQEEPFSKVAELKHKGYDDKGIAKIIAIATHDSAWNEENNNEEVYNTIVKETARHNDLKAAGQDDAYIAEEVNKKIKQIHTTRETFGDDVLNYAISFKTDNYLNFAQGCANLKSNCSEEFINNLKSKLDELPSPELKAKRLRILGGLTGKVDENAMNVLVNMIKSPKMTDAQVDIANRIFTPEYPEGVNVNEEYEKRVNQYVEEICAPAQFKQTVHDYLMKVRIDRTVERPKSIEEQLAKMADNAQQTLINPKIPLEKKIAYIDEYKAKKAEMESNPDKFLKPYIYPKAMTNLAKVVEAYVNIPNDDIKFNNSITSAMYTQLGIETTPELLAKVHYDSKYFDKLFASQYDFRNNFKKLIELTKMTNDMPLTEARLTLPEADSPHYDKYQQLGLIKQIEANLDTVRQFKEHRLDFDKWDTFNPDFVGEIFSVEADPETEFQNLRYNLINIFQDDLWNMIDSKEREKLTQDLSNSGFTIFNNEIYRGGKKAENPDLERFMSYAESYISNNEYWKGASENNNLSQREKDGITGFTDHLNGCKKRYQEVRNARTVNDIHFRLSDDNDIGRNIFFGNHVGCCNSVESTYAGYSAPMHLLNNYNRGLELVDNWGNSYGNSLCYFADVDDELTFIIDSFEANGKLGSNPIVTDNLIKFAKQVCKEMGREDAKVMVGPSFNNMDMSKLKSTAGHKIKVVGTVSDRTYCDSVGGKVLDAINQPVENRSMLVYQEE